MLDVDNICMRSKTNMQLLAKHVVVPLGLLVFMQPSAFAAEEHVFTLAQSVQRAVMVAPEMEAAKAEIGKQFGALESANAWPNPTVSLQIDDNLNREVNGTGYSVTEFSVSQPLPFWRLESQRQQAKALINSAEAQKKQQQLMLEFQVAQLFHDYQLKEAKLQLAEQRLKQARKYQSGGRGKGNESSLVRYLTPLETMRLDIMLQAAQQSVELAEGEFYHAASRFKALLNIPVTSGLKLTPLTPVSLPAPLAELQKYLEKHPALQAEQQAVASLEASVEVAEKERFADPTLTLFRKTAFLGNRRQPNTGIALSVQVPLWDQNEGGVTRAQQSVYQTQARLDIKQRELQTSLKMSRLHLEHLMNQAENYRTKLLKQAKRVFKLTREGFDAGELNILTLIDANNTYFDAQARYLTLLQESWLELSMVRKSAGLSLLSEQDKHTLEGAKSL